MEWNEGDRVVIREADGWLQPRRGWAERGRQGTVKNIITRHHGNVEVAVLFDRTRNPHTGLEYFKPEDLAHAP